MNVKKILIYFICLTWLSSPALADFVSVSLSYDRFENPKFKGAQSSLVGPGFNLGFGFLGQFPFQLFITHSSLTGIVNHDDKEQAINLTFLSYGIKKSVFINSNVYLNFGYVIQDLAFEFPDSTNLGEAGIQNYFEIEDQESEGVIYGIGYNLQEGKSANFFIEYNIQQQSTMNSTVDSVYLGYRFKND